jgi:hypothetical protein
MKEFPRMGSLDTAFEISHFLFGLRYMPRQTFSPLFLNMLVVICGL